MATQDPTRSCPDAPASEDTRTERAVLAFLLDQHPDRLTIPELALALNASQGFAAEDAVERAVRELVGAGLLHAEGALVLPTRAALYFERLERG
jgi:hypothetical protein